MAHLIRDRLCETGYKAWPSKRGAILVVSNLVAAVRDVSKRSPEEIQCVHNPLPRAPGVVERYVAKELVVRIVRSEAGPVGTL